MFYFAEAPDGNAVRLEPFGGTMYTTADRPVAEAAVAATPGAVLREYKVEVL